MVKIIIECVSDYKNVEVVCWDDLIAEFCVENGVKYLVCGLRNTSDYLYEEEIAKINQEIAPKLRTMYLRATNDTISSSMVWELYTRGRDVEKYLPYFQKLLCL